MSDTDESLKCPKCDFVGTSKMSLGKHKSSAHGIHGPNYKYQKDWREKNRKVKSGKTAPTTKINIGEWKFCPCCGVNLPSMLINMATVMSLASPSVMSKKAPADKVNLGHWKHCPNCGEHLPQLIINMASLMAMTSKRYA